MSTRHTPLLFISLLVAATACIDEQAVQAPQIRAITPMPLIAGSSFNVQGDNFGNSGTVSIGSTVVTLDLWGPEQIVGVVPQNATDGPTILQLRRGQSVLATAPVVINSRMDGSLTPAPSLEGMANIDADLLPGLDASDKTQANQMSPIATNGRILRGFFNADSAESDVTISTRQAQDGLIFLQIQLGHRASDVGGIAFHLVYDSALVEYEAADQSEGIRFQAKPIAPGRLAVGWVRRSSSPSALELRFRLVGPGEGRLDFPPRYRTLRDRQNQPILSTSWASGSVRIEVVEE